MMQVGLFLLACIMLAQSMDAFMITPQHSLVSIKRQSSFVSLLQQQQQQQRRTISSNTWLYSSDQDAVEELVVEEEETTPSSPPQNMFISQGEVISKEELMPDLQDPKQTRVIIYIILSLLPVLFLIPLILGSRDFIPPDSLPPVEL